jgi:hypothetical protein
VAGSGTAAIIHAPSRVEEYGDGMGGPPRHLKVQVSMVDITGRRSLVEPTSVALALTLLPSVVLTPADSSRIGAERPSPKARCATGQAT